MIVRSIATVLLALHMCGVIQAQEQAAAPFGLKFGMSKAEVKSMGVVLLDEKVGAFGAEARARNLPKALSNTEAVFLVFGFDDQLFRVGAVSKTWDHDENGYQATRRFDEISSMISELYGKGKDIGYAPTETYYTKPENFAYSLSQHKRQHAQGWTVGQVTITLKIGSSHLDTYCVLVYEDTARAANAKKGQRGREKEAL
jgi:hypothetical protein